MFGSSQHGATSVIDDAVEAYEIARGRDGRADLEAFLPAPGHPLYLAVLCELVRVDLEYGYEEKRPDRLEDYERRFPELFRDPERAREIAFEECRLRREAGESPSVAEYRDRFGVQSLDRPASVPRTDPKTSSPPAEMTHAATVYRRYRLDGGTDLASRLAASGVASMQAEFFEILCRDDPTAADQLAKALITLSETGGRFLGFQLRAELGRGAFSRVFVAEQEEMSGRLVALKITPDAGNELNALPQLPHSNVVPIYSLHRRGSLQALCMPYFGSTTLEDVIAGLDEDRTLPDSGRGFLSILVGRKRRLPGAVRRVESRPLETSPATARPDEIPGPVVNPPTARMERIGRSNYVDAILWIGAALADGLAHSHERGILHGNLKPANVLLSDDGEPMLLDFNLAAESKLRGRASTALVSGTLPYMSLEQLESLQGKPRSIDARSDLFSLGVILYRLLSGRHPFGVHRGPVADVLARNIEDRRGPVPSLWTRSRPGSAAVDAIIGRLLDPEPDRRYQSARDLQEDLRRQLDNLPLKLTPEPSTRERLSKWARRHPRLTSARSIVAASLVIVAALAIGIITSQNRLQHLEAHATLDRLTTQVGKAEFLLLMPDIPIQKIDEGIALCQQAVDAFGARTDPSWLARPPASMPSAEDRDRLRRKVGELLVLWARALVWKAEASTDRRAERIAEAEKLIALAEASYGSASASRDLRIQSAALARLAGHDAEADRLLAEAERLPIGTTSERLVLVSSYLNRGMDSEALDLAEEASRVDPLYFSVWLIRGHCLLRVAQVERAVQSFSLGIALQPGFDWAYLDRGRAMLVRRDFARAQADFDRVLDSSPDQPEALLNRSLARLDGGNPQGAIADLDRLLRRADAPTRALFIRSQAHRVRGDEAAAEADHREGLSRIPRDEMSWVFRGLNHLPSDPAKALEDFRNARKLNPKSLEALQREASVLSETLGRTEEAIKVLDQALAYFPQLVSALSSRSVLLARLGRRKEALKDVAAARSLDNSSPTLFRAACTFALTSKKEPGDVSMALRLLALAIRKDGALLGQMDTDPDLASLRDRPEFQKLRDALRIVCPPTEPPK